LKRVLQALSLAVVLLVLLLAAAPFTESGTRRLVEAISKFTPLEMAYGGGTLAGELWLTRVAPCASAR
jgi:autotransporter translocation and assembly factor TamB